MMVLEFLLIVFIVCAWPFSFWLERSAAKPDYKDLWLNMILVTLLYGSVIGTLHYFFFDPKFL